MIICLQESEGENGEAVFSRSGHINSLGYGLQLTSLNDQPTSTRQPDNKPNHPIIASDISTQHEQLTSTQHEQLTNTQQLNEDKSWEQFKTNFSEGLQESEDQLSQDAAPSLADIKQHLLVNAILSMHSDPSPPDNGVVGSKSPSKHRKNLLSMNSLETIHESELDRMLESDELLTNGGSVVTGESPPAAPRLVWAKEDTGQLMIELARLNKNTTTTRSENSRVGKSYNLSNGMIM